MHEKAGFSLIFGASGGIGAALVRATRAGGRPVWSVSRRPAIVPSERHSVLAAIDEVSLQALAQELQEARAELGELREIIVATGALTPDGHQPEKSLRQQNAAAFEALFGVNTILPALVAAQLIPMLPPKGRCLFAALSARVGSISDNRLGGWHAYRASKAALNMLIKCYAIEGARRNAEMVCLGLHPGTVDTPLSRPFQRNVPAPQLKSPPSAAEALRKVLDEATPSQSGQILDWAGLTIPA